MRAAIIAHGARSTVGLDALQTALGFRSQRLTPGASRFRDGFDRPIGLARLRALPDDIDGFDRLVALAAPALREAASGLAGPTVLLLAAPEPHPAFSADEGPQLAAAIAETAMVKLDATHSTVFASGAAGFALAVERALDLLDRDPSRPVVVGGVDSYYDPARLKALDGERRLLSPEAPSGMLPSEGAGFVVLGRGGDPRCAIVAAVTGAEDAAASDEPVMAETLTLLLETAERRLGAGSAPWIIVDDLSERHRHREWSFAAARRESWCGDQPAVVDQLAVRAGSVGAASGVLAMIWATVGIRAGFAPSGSVLIVLASDGPARGVIALASHHSAP